MTRSAKNSGLFSQTALAVTVPCRATLVNEPRPDRSGYPVSKEPSVRAEYSDSSAIDTASSGLLRQADKANARSRNRFIPIPLWLKLKGSRFRSEHPVFRTTSLPENRVF